MKKTIVTPKFLDLFSGCGGLSLGLTYAGLQGLFAIERDTMAFQTFSHNFLTTRSTPINNFDWPIWLEPRAWSIDEFLTTHGANIGALSGTVDVMAGGPPCQGFSFAGRRKADDPRNMLFEKYAEVVEKIKPKILVIENVPGMLVAHNNENGDPADQSYYQRLTQRLKDLGYQVRGEIVDASRFGVPQKRSRLIIIGVRADVALQLNGGAMRVFEMLELGRKRQLDQLGLPDSICTRDAISDLRTTNRSRIDCSDPISPKGFQEIRYKGPITTYQKLMHRHCDDPMDSMRLARHSFDVVTRFERILQECDRGVAINQEERIRLGIKKHRTHPMAPREPAPTITTLPDDVLHYAEPRILTVRESARIQSFPDWFQFRGKYTTGGALRTKECPRYTQVGNAVPPLLGRAIGVAICAALAEASSTRQQDCWEIPKLLAA
jgi:DNA (cytosine-5)-methyltransferase 1